MRVFDDYDLQNLQQIELANYYLFSAEDAFFRWASTLDEDNCIWYI